MADLKPLDLKLITLSQVPQSSDPAMTHPQSLLPYFRSCVTTTTIGFICMTITKYYSIAKAT